VFETGVSSYVVGIAEVENSFPVDERGVPHISCSHCKFFKFSQPRCMLNNEICDFPDKFRGARCPLYFPDN
jgi:hypothetical protein